MGKDGVVTGADLAAGLKAVGLRPGMGVMVHSSLRSFGYVEGGEETVIATLMELITSEGTLMMPSFNHRVAFRAGGAGYWSPTETPTMNGAIPERFWRMPGVYRSLHPTHSCAAWGRHARRYTACHHRALTMGPGSPLGLLFADGGYGLLLGVGYRVNSFHHVVEMSTGAPCLGLRDIAYPMVLPDGRRVEGRTWSFRDKECPHTRPDGYAEEMACRGLHRQVKIGESCATFFRLEDCYDVYARLLREGKGDRPPCSRCSIRPWAKRKRVASDWDVEAGRLRPDSPAWDY